MLFSAPKSTRSNFRGACDKALLEGLLAVYPNRILEGLLAVYPNRILEGLLAVYPNRILCVSEDQEPLNAPFLNFGAKKANKQKTHKHFSDGPCGTIVPGTNPHPSQGQTAFTVELNRKRPVCPRDGSQFVPGRGPVCPRDGSCLSRTPSRPKCLCLLVFALARLMGCFPMDFQEVKRPLRTKSGKRPIKVGKRPSQEGKRPIKAMVLVGISVGCLMGCFRAPPPWRKTAPLQRPIKRSMMNSRKCSEIVGVFYLMTFYDEFCQ